MTDDNSSGSRMVPQWDGKAETYALYREKFGAVAVYYGCDFVMDASEMRAMPGKTAYTTLKAIDPTNQSNDDKKHIQLYEQNTKMCSIFVLGQSSNHGLMQLVATKSDEFPHGKLWEAFGALDRKKKPEDFTAEVEMQTRLKAIQFKRADDYKTEFTNIGAEYKFVMEEAAKLKIMMKRVKSATYAQIIVSELKKANPDFSQACQDISEIQRAAGLAESKPEPKPGKEVALNSTEKSGGGGKQKKCRHCSGAHLQKDCERFKAALKKQGNCPECGKDDHLEKGCWKKHPELAPKWWGKRNGKEVSNASVELMLASIESEQDFA